jgi:signal transduction histidine kinase
MVMPAGTLRWVGLCGFTISLLLIAALTWENYRIVGAHQSSEVAVRRTYRVIDHTTNIASSLRAVLASSRGELLTPSLRFRELMHASIEDVRNHFRSLSHLVPDNSPQSSRLSVLEAEAERVIATVTETIQASAEAATISTLIVRSRDEMDVFIAEKEIFVAGEQQLLDGRLDQANHYATTTQRWVVAAGCGSAVLLLMALIAVERQLIARKRLADSLEMRVQERTRDLAQANQDLECFSYSIAHDLKAPLRAVEGYANLAARRLAACRLSEVDRYLEKIGKQATASAQLVNDLLTLAKVGCALDLTAEVALEPLTLAVWDDLEAQRQQRACETTCTVQALPTTLGDATMLRQVFANLVGNALKYARDGEPQRIEVGYLRRALPDLSSGVPRPSADPRKHHVIFVRDTGMGFAMEDYPKLFAAFQRLHVTHIDGSGLGLAICKRIIERHGGVMWAESRVQVGTTVYFSLPVASLHGNQGSQRLGQIADAVPV